MQCVMNYQNVVKQMQKVGGLRMNHKLERMNVVQLIEKYGAAWLRRERT